jgi:hypothetical protein
MDTDDLIITEEKIELIKFNPSGTDMNLIFTMGV